MQVQIRTAKMHFFAEYGAEAAHWQYKERCYGQAGCSVDEETLAAAGPTAASAPAGSAVSGAAREANWAKYCLSQQVGAGLLLGRASVYHFITVL